MLKDGELAALKVSDINKIGAFLDWGEPKELMLPYAEMTCDLHKGQEILIRKYTDKSERPAASMKSLYSMLSTESPYRAGDEVTGRIYEFAENFGTFVAVDDKYSAMIPKHESMSDFEVGDIVTAKVKFVKEDGKLDLTLRQNKIPQMKEDSEKILYLLEQYSGVLPFTEKATPEVILREVGISKAAFKRAIGRLYKERKIEITSQGKIRKI